MEKKITKTDNQMEQVFPKEQVRGSFNLRTPKSNKPSLIYFVITLDGKRYKIPMGVKVYPSQWSKKHQRAIVSHKLTEADNRNNTIVNEKIDELLFCFNDFLLYICKNPETLEKGAHPILCNYFNFNMRKKKQEIDIIQFLEEAAYNKGGRSVKNLLAYLKHLREYIEYREAEGKGRIRTFKELATTSVFRGFLDYVQTVQRGKLKVSYVNEMVSKLQTMLRNYAIGDVNEGFLDRATIDSIDYHKIKDRSNPENQVWLRNDEVMRLYRHVCKNKQDEQIRDLFLLECTTGHRYSDIPELVEHTHVKEGIMFCSIVTKKTSHPLDVPVKFDIARQILNKYKETGLPKVHANTYRKHIKDICREAGITQPVNQAHHFVGVASPQTARVPTFKLVGTHTGRRTFISLLALRRYPDNQIGRLTGQTNQTVERYLRSVKPIDYEIYEKQRKNNPDNIVKTIDEADNGSLQASGSHDEASAYGADKLKELRDVLVYLGASYEDVADIANEDELNAMLYGQYERKLLDIGVERGTLKTIFNAEGLTLKEKKALLGKTAQEVAELAALAK